jgi:hypothetical protein
MGAMAVLALYGLSSTGGAGAAAGPAMKPAATAPAATAPAGEALPIYGGASATYRNVALNPKDVHGQPKSSPHATSNSECRNESAFFALNAINGRCENTGHGGRFPSWGPDQREDLWWKVDFGRPVEIDKLCLYIRADFPHDKYWHSATVELSDGTRLPIRIEKTKDKQTFEFPKRTVTWLRLTGLVQAKPLGWAAITQVEVYGRDAAGPATATAPADAPAAAGR